MSTIELIQADITTLQVDAIVNAANNALQPGAGVCGAIHRAAGAELAKECTAIGGCPTGEARLTDGYQLPAKFVIHTVGPVWCGGTENEAELLASCYRQTLQLAQQEQLESIAFPAISCGVYGYPLAEATAIAVQTVREVTQEASSLKRVLFVAFGDDVAEAYRKFL